MPHFVDTISDLAEWSHIMKQKPDPSPLNKRTVEELELQERLIIKYVEKGMTREEAALQALADLRDRKSRE
jgi:hypothetical protein